MNVTETKQDWVTKLKVLSTKKKIMYVVGIIVVTQLLGGLSIY